MGASVSQRYLHHLSDTDLGLLATAAGLEGGSGDDPSEGAAAALLRAEPELLTACLDAPATFARLVGGEPAEGDALPPWSAASPFLLFAVTVHRGLADLGSSSFVAEPFGGHRRIPVFDTAALHRRFSDPDRRLVAIEHLSSYTRVSSGAVWAREPGARRARPVRFSELDPVRLARLLEIVDPAERPGIYRRLGDLALFLTGVFPDHVAERLFRPIQVERLRWFGVGTG
jgi:hypothetical protein